MNLKKCLYSLVATILLTHLVYFTLFLYRENGHNTNSITMTYFSIGLLFFAIATVVGAFISIRKIRSGFKNFSSNLQGQSSGLHQESLHINDNSDELRGLINSQAGSLHQIASSLDEIRAMATSNSDTATTSQKQVEEGYLFTEQGSQEMSKLSLSIERVQSSSTNMSDTMTESVDQLSEVSGIIKNISEKTSIINDIVFQTKLLSFNASVEAARAGAEGKGFAVVAEEVGNLAAMSGQAASEISELVDNSIKAVDRIIDTSKTNIEVSLSEANREITECTEISNHCSSVFAKISEKIGSVKSSVELISSSSQEQTAGIEQLADGMHSITNDSQNVEFIALQVGKIASNLSSQSTEINQLHEDFNFSLLGESGVEKLPLEPLEWGPEYYIGIEAMDTQHGVLVGYINKFIESMDSEGTQHLLAPYQKMKEYTIEHFSLEETFLKQINFPGLEGHQSIHKKLIATVVGIEAQIKNDSIDREGTTAFLKNWLISHIQGVDTKYAKFYSESDSHLSKAA